ncbi:hypothetical protein TRFO_30678 [Tritrichomonas foetus]|uniref:Uncharacterized protein n=1 Tax=Tritrichomonas foetus TaxID=1144522 RepID=A0A1J4JT12_9EUKA|nr:hypothetical protein TRFO_30678 [Tritrichomonas foetus]|eukprot:OHT02257.1 hypothetical protein TRFO_30678 [Tritrichomonas foetus]
MSSKNINNKRSPSILGQSLRRKPPPQHLTKAHRFFQDKTSKLPLPITHLPYTTGCLSPNTRPPKPLVQDIPAFDPDDPFYQIEKSTKVINNLVQTYETQQEDSNLQMLAELDSAFAINALEPKDIIIQSKKNVDNLINQNKVLKDNQNSMLGSLQTWMQHEEQVLRSQEGKMKDIQSDVFSMPETSEDLFTILNSETGSNQSRISKIVKLHSDIVSKSFLMIHEYQKRDNEQQKLIKDLQERCKSISPMPGRRAKNHQSNKTELQKQLEQAMNRIQTQDDTIKRLNERIEQLITQGIMKSASNDELDENSIQKSHDILNLEIKVDKLQNEISSLNDTNFSLKQQISSLEADNTYYKSHIESLKDLVEVERSKRDAQLREFLNKAADEENNGEKVKTSQKLNANTESVGKIVALEKEISDLKNEMNEERRKAHEQNKKEMESLRREYETRELEIKRRQIFESTTETEKKVVEAMQNQCDLEKNALIKNYDDKIQEMMKNNSDLMKKSLSEKDDKIKELQNLLEKVVKDNSTPDISEHIEKMKSEYEEKEIQLKTELQSRLEEARSDFQKHQQKLMSDIKEKDEYISKLMQMLCDEQSKHSSILNNGNLESIKEELDSKDIEIKELKELKEKVEEEKLLEEMIKSVRTADGDEENEEIQEMKIKAQRSFEMKLTQKLRDQKMSLDKSWQEQYDVLTQQLKELSDENERISSRLNEKVNELERENEELRNKNDFESLRSKIRELEENDQKKESQIRKFQIENELLKKASEKGTDDDFALIEMTSTIAQQTDELNRAKEKLRETLEELDELKKAMLNLQNDEKKKNKVSYEDLLNIFEFVSCDIFSYEHQPQLNENFESMHATQPKRFKKYFEVNSDISPDLQELMRKSKPVTPKNQSQPHLFVTLEMENTYEFENLLSEEIGRTDEKPVELSNNEIEENIQKENKSDASDIHEKVKIRLYPIISMQFTRDFPEILEKPEIVYKLPSPRSNSSSNLSSNLYQPKIDIQKFDPITISAIRKKLKFRNNMIIETREPPKKPICSLFTPFSLSLEQNDQLFTQKSNLNLKGVFEKVTQYSIENAELVNIFDIDHVNTQDIEKTDIACQIASKPLIIPRMEYFEPTEIFSLYKEVVLPDFEVNIQPSTEQVFDKMNNPITTQLLTQQGELINIPPIHQIDSTTHPAAIAVVTDNLVSSARQISKQLQLVVSEIQAIEQEPDTQRKLDMQKTIGLTLEIEKDSLVSEMKERITQLESLMKNTNSEEIDIKSKPNSSNDITRKRSNNDKNPQPKTKLSIQRVNSQELMFKSQKFFDESNSQQDKENKNNFSGASEIFSSNQTLPKIQLSMSTAHNEIIEGFKKETHFHTMAQLGSLTFAPAENESQMIHQKIYVDSSVNHQDIQFNHQNSSNKAVNFQFESKIEVNQEPVSIPENRTLNKEMKEMATSAVASRIQSAKPDSNRNENHDNQIVVIEPEELSERTIINLNKEKSHVNINDPPPNTPKRKISLSFTNSVLADEISKSTPTFENFKAIQNQQKHLNPLNLIKSVIADVETNTSEQSEGNEQQDLQENSKKYAENGIQTIDTSVVVTQSQYAGIGLKDALKVPEKEISLNESARNSIPPSISSLKEETVNNIRKRVQLNNVQAANRRKNFKFTRTVNECINIEASVNIEALKAQVVAVQSSNNADEALDALVQLSKSLDVININQSEPILKLQNQDGISTQSQLYTAGNPLIAQNGSDHTEGSILEEPIGLTKNNSEMHEFLSRKSSVLFTVNESNLKRAIDTTDGLAQRLMSKQVNHINHQDGIVKKMIDTTSAFLRQMDKPGGASHSSQSMFLRNMNDIATELSNTISELQAEISDDSDLKNSLQMARDELSKQEDLIASLRQEIIDLKQNKDAPTIFKQLVDLKEDLEKLLSKKNHGKTTVTKKNISDGNNTTNDDFTTKMVRDLDDAVRIAPTFLRRAASDATVVSSGASNYIKRAIDLIPDWDKLVPILDTVIDIINGGIMKRRNDDVIQQMNDQNNELLKEITKLRSDMIIKDRDISAMNLANDKQLKQLRVALEAANSQIEMLERQIKNIDRDVEIKTAQKMEKESLEKLTKSEKKNIELSQALDDVREQLEAYKNRFNDIFNQATDSQTNNEVLRSRANEILKKADIDMHKARVLEKMNKEITTEVDKLEKSLETLRHEKTISDQKVIELEAKLEDQSRRHLDDLAKKLFTEGGNSVGNAEIPKLIKLYQQRAMIYQAQLDKKSSDMIKMRGKRADEQKSLMLLKRELSRLKKEMNLTKLRYESSQSEISLLHQTVANRDETIRLLKREIDRLRNLLKSKAVPLAEKIKNYEKAENEAYEESLKATNAIETANRLKERFKNTKAASSYFENVVKRHKETLARIEQRRKELKEIERSNELENIRAMAQLVRESELQIPESVVVQMMPHPAPLKRQLRKPLTIDDRNNNKTVYKTDENGNSLRNHDIFSDASNIDEIAANNQPKFKTTSYADTLQILGSLVGKKSPRTLQEMLRNARYNNVVIAVNEKPPPQPKRGQKNVASLAVKPIRLPK